MAVKRSWQETLDDADDATAALIIRLQRDDIAELAAPRSANRTANTDESLARQAYEIELMHYLAVRRCVREDTPFAEVPAAAIPNVPAVEPLPIVEEQQPAFFACTACGEQKPADDIYQVPCHHRYCHQCLGDLFQSATTDESLFPPRCCRQEIPFDDVEPVLPGAARDSFDGKREELSDLHRVYCRIPTCSAYISDANREGGVGTCPTCSTQTCRHCKNEPHDGECTQDDETKEVLRIATEEGWQRCPGCERMIELTIGCNHMTCVCRAQFCYVCRALWKNCQCPQWNEERLLARGQVIAEREHGPGAHPAQVQAAVQNLRARHECDHQNWSRVEGGHECEECHDFLRVYIYRCTQCRMQACLRCKDNRL